MADNDSDDREQEGVAGKGADSEILLQNFEIGRLANRLPQTIERRQAKFGEPTLI